MFYQQIKFSSISWLNYLRRCSMLFIAMLGAVLIKSGFSYDSMITLFKAAFLFGLLGGACYTLIFTTQVKIFVEKIGLFNAFLNAGLLYLVAKMLPSFQVNHFSTAFWAGILINLISWMMSMASLFAPALTTKTSSRVKQARARVIGTRSNEISEE